MAITSLRINDFRNLAAVDVIPCVQGLNIIAGHNGSGKTSLLEAIHYLGLGRSFRSASSSRLIRHATDKFSVFAQLLSSGQRDIPVGVERDTHGIVRSRIAEKDAASVAELAYLLPIRIINSQSHQLFEAGPVFRRKYLDWGLFYHFDAFFLCWRQFERVLKQRNIVLRDQLSRQELDVWTAELLKYSIELDNFRRDYINMLQPVLAELTGELLDMRNLEIHYSPGWDDSQSFAEILASNYHQERRSGYTQVGPHRADFDIRLDGISVKHFLSRGQQKLLICAMILAQGMLLAKCVNKSLIYLIDDLPSELDLYSRQKLISLLAKQPTQIFITAVESETICALLNKSDVSLKVFHVEHGNVGAMAKDIASQS